MTDARPTCPTPVPSERKQTTTHTMGRALSPREEWLKQLRPLDQVAVYCGSQLMEIATVTSAPRMFVTIGKYNRKANFSRDDGRLCGKLPMGHWFRIEQP
jgi:hypothetical protein